MTRRLLYGSVFWAGCLLLGNSYPADAQVRQGNSRAIRSLTPQQAWIITYHAQGYPYHLSNPVYYGSGAYFTGISPGTTFNPQGVYVAPSVNYSNPYAPAIGFPYMSFP